MRKFQNDRPCFAIVTPSFNQAEFLEQTILSVLEQKGRGTDFELKYAVIDGGSKDDSVDIIRKYQGDLTYWCSEPDRGQTHAINKGFSHIQGDIHAYLNSDDFYLPGAFGQVAETFRDDERIDLLHGVCHKVDVDGGFVTQQLGKIENLSEILDLWNYWLRPKDNLNFIQPEVFWSAELASRIGPFDESLFYTMDFDYWLRGFDLGMNVKTLQVPLAAFRMHGNQKTSARNASILELLDRITPYLESNNDQISAEDSRRMRTMSQFTREMIAAEKASPSQQVRSMLSLAAEEPGLLWSNHFWRHLRRSGRRVLWNRHRAA